MNSLVVSMCCNERDTMVKYSPNVLHAFSQYHALVCFDDTALIPFPTTPTASVFICNQVYGVSAKGVRSRISRVGGQERDTYRHRRLPSSGRPSLHPRQSATAVKLVQLTRTPATRSELLEELMISERTDANWLEAPLYTRLKEKKRTHRLDPTCTPVSASQAR